MVVTQTLYDMLSPKLATAGLDLIDVEVGASLVRVTVDRDGGVDLDTLASANKLVSAALDEHDPVAGRYTLEVSSPGVERRLRTPEHFMRAVGETVSVRTVAGSGDVRRIQGELRAADPEGFEVVGDDVPDGSVRLAYGDVERARTVFFWGPRAPQAANRRSKQRANKNPRTERVTTP